MRKFVATAAVAASAAATLAMTPLAAHAALPGDGAEIRTGCQNGLTGYYVEPGGSTVHGFEVVPGSEWSIPDAAPGIWQFFVNKPESLEAYGPALGSDKSAPWATQRVEKAVVNLEGGSEHIFFNDTANGFQFNVPVGIPTFSVYYQCGIGKG